MYRKFTADQIFDGYQLQPADTVLITTPDGTVVELVNRADAGDEVQQLKGVLTPGFINAHCHLELSHLKNAVPTHTGLVQFVQTVMTTRLADESVKTAAMAAAAQEMYAAGIVAVGDICNTADTIAVKQQSHLQWHNFIEVSGFVAEAAPKRLADIKKVQEAFFAQHQTAPLSPHAPYSVSTQLFSDLNLETTDQLISIHNQECAAENELYQSKSGGFLNLFAGFGIDISHFSPTQKTSLQSWLPYFSQRQRIIAVHNTFTSQADIDFARPWADALSYCLCVNANLYIEQNVPPIELLRQNNCTIVLGTDSYASNWQLSILEEMKAIQQHAPVKIPLQEMLQWATSNGARALGMDKKLGSFEKDKQPGVVLIDHITQGAIDADAQARRII